MAERIADPIRRLTRATGRIARGDFDARIAVRSSDELRRLVDAFNRMAAELKAQRDQLERTHRLEAWAEMARQVAHEIKNPLTPIQLSAEHLRRVHADRGEPLGAGARRLRRRRSSARCALLRQIAAEFSSFASSPTARPRAGAIPCSWSHDVVEPYRAGLAGRIEIDNDVAAALPPCRRRSHAGRPRADQHHRERAARDARRRHADASTSRVDDGDRARSRVADTGVGMDAEALDAGVRAVFLDEDDGHGPRAADREAQHRVERRHDRRGQREGRGTR